MSITDRFVNGEVDSDYYIAPNEKTANGFYYNLVCSKTNKIIGQFATHGEARRKMWMLEEIKENEHNNGGHVMGLKESIKELTSIIDEFEKYNKDNNDKEVSLKLESLYSKLEKLVEEAQTKESEIIEESIATDNLISGLKDVIVETMMEYAQDVKDALEESEPIIDIIDDVTSSDVSEVAVDELVGALGESEDDIDLIIVDDENDDKDLKLETKTPNSQTKFPRLYKVLQDTINDLIGIEDEFSRLPKTIKDGSIIAIIYGPLSSPASKNLHSVHGALKFTDGKIENFELLDRDYEKLFLKDIYDNQAEIVKAYEEDLKSAGIPETDTAKETVEEEIEYDKTSLLIDLSDFDTEEDLLSVINKWKDIRQKKGLPTEEAVVEQTSELLEALKSDSDLVKTLEDYMSMYSLDLYDTLEAMFKRGYFKFMNIEIDDFLAQIKTIKPYETKDGLKFNEALITEAVEDEFSEDEETNDVDAFEDDKEEDVIVDETEDVSEPAEETTIDKEVLVNNLVEGFVYAAEKNGFIPEFLNEEITSDTIKAWATEALSSNSEDLNEASKAFGLNVTTFKQYLADLIEYSNEVAPLVADIVGDILSKVETPSEEVPEEEVPTEEPEEEVIAEEEPAPEDEEEFF